jgi:glyoxylase-like metal-dependent hydrolase (beta-lactamase superfamily II)
MATLVGNWGGGFVWRVTSGAFPSNAYFCEANVPGGCILIDAGLDGPAIDAAMTERGLRPHQVFCTHGHFDHAGSAAYFQKKYDCPIFMHQADARTLKASNFLLMAFKIRQKIEIPEVTYIENQGVLDISGQSLTYLPAPGHTPGSCVLQFGSAWFTGDTIYSQGVGLSSLPGEDVKKLKQSILGLWDRLAEDRTIFPGHGPAASSASIRSGNHALLKFLELIESDSEVQ